jgi:hypothetical protein
VRRLAIATATFLGVCAGAPLIASGASSVANEPREPVATSSGGHVTWHDVPNPEVIDDALGLYLVWQESPLGQRSIDALDRVDRHTGRIEASRDLRAQFANSVVTSGSLFVTTMSSRGEDLLRLNPVTLNVTTSWQVTRTQVPNGGGSLAVVNGGLWVTTGDRLLRLSLGSNSFGTSVTLPGAEISDVASDTRGDVLVVGTTGNDGEGSVERRDPRTGALLASSAPFDGVTAPTVSAVADGAVWVSVSTGMMGYTEELVASTLKPAGPPCTEVPNTALCVTGSNGIDASVSGSLLWVTQPGGGPLRNYCGDPRTGRVFATIPLKANEKILTTGSTEMYLFDQVSTGQDGEILTEMRVPSKCAPS